MRGQILAIRKEEFITAARSVGNSNARIIFRHMLPNIFAPLTVLATLGVANAILLEAALSFLGLGVALQHRPGVACLTMHSRRLCSPLCPSCGLHPESPSR